MLICDFTPDYLEDILTVEQSSFSHPWTRNMFLSELAAKHTRYRVAVINNRAIAYMGMWICANEGQITNIAVSPAYRRTGIATKLLADFIAYAQKNALSSLTLEVRASNTTAQALYAKLDFTPVGRRKNYYENTEDAILMTKFFQPTD